MNEIIKKFSLKGDKFMPEMRLRQPRNLPIALVDHLLITNR